MLKDFKDITNNFGSGKSRRKGRQGTQPVGFLDELVLD